MTSVRVRGTVDEAWNRFYDDWVTTFTAEVPGTRRGSRWRVTSELVDGNEQVPVREWPMYLAFEEYDRLDEFVLSRSWRKEAYWEPRVRSFDTWFKDLTDYATLNLQKLDRERGDLGTVPPAILTSTWTVDPASLLEFQRWRTAGAEERATHALNHLAVHHYLAALAQLHRHGGPSGEARDSPTTSLRGWRSPLLRVDDRARRAADTRAPDGDTR